MKALDNRFFVKFMQLEIGLLKLSFNFYVFFTQAKFWRQI